MPCHAARARQLVRQGKAIKRHDRGLVYLQLTRRTAGATQPIACGIDPGSKKEGLVVQSKTHTFLNLQADAVTWVSEAVQTRRQMRRLRRSRKAPHRPYRPNRLAGQTRLPPSTRARWGLKVRLVRWLARYYPLTVIVIEDVAAPTRPGKRRWNASFSPLEVGKQWCYRQLETIAAVQTVPGYVTKALREEAGLHKSSRKVSDAWNAHCVDAFVLATAAVGGPAHPTSRQMLYLVPLRFHRRQLHRFQAEKGGLRKPYGGTLSLGLKRGAWVRHPRWGLAYVGGTTNGRISLHDMQTGKRLTQNAHVSDCRVLCTASWRMRAESRLKQSAPPAAQVGGFSHLFRT